MSRSDTGVVHGRFQPFHIGHLDYVLWAMERCSFLYVGLANPDPSLTKPHSTNARRALPECNPFTYFERLTMVRNTLLQQGISVREYEIVPFPINFPEYIGHYTPLEAVYYITIYDDWGRAKQKMLQEQIGVRVEVLEEGSPDLKRAEGTRIRKLMRTDGDWQRYVPDAVRDYIQGNDLVERVL